MNKMIVIGCLVGMPLIAMGSLHVAPVNLDIKVQPIPSRFTASSQVTTLQWGCPVADIVKANSRSEALQKISTECMEEVKRAAIDKPDVFDVLRTSVVWPDVRVSEEAGFYHLKGTFFLETLVLQNAPGKAQ